ncbi:MAG: V-type ATP synthase subunit E [Thermodesulfobacteriota bacterium]
MPKDSLLQVLEEDASAQCAMITAEAEAEAEEVIASAAKEAGETRLGRISALERTLARQRTSALNAARTRANSARLKVRHDLIEEVLSAAVERFRKIPEKEYSALVNRLYHEALDEVHHRAGVRPVVYVNPADAGLLDAEEADIKTDECVSLGVVVTDPAGRLRSENTLAGRLQRARKHLVPLIDGILFG